MDKIVIIIFNNINLYLALGPCFGVFIYIYFLFLYKSVC